MNEQVNWESILSDAMSDGSAIHLQGQVHIKIALPFITEGAFLTCRCPAWE